MKKIVKIFGLILICFFIITFLNRDNYYDNNSVISDEAITRFEADLKSGKNINPKDYMKEKKNYNNKTTILFLKFSKTIEKVVNKGLKSFISYLDN